MKHIRTYTSDKDVAQTIADKLNALQRKRIYGTSAYSFHEYFSFAPIPHNATNHFQTTTMAGADATIFFYEGFWRVQFFEAFEEEASQVENELRDSLKL